MINALLSSVVQLLEVMALTLFCLMIFALFALEVYMGKLRHKCVKNMGPLGLVSELERDEYWLRHVDNPRNWLKRDFPYEEFVMCSNDSGTRWVIVISHNSLFAPKNDCLINRQFQTLPQ